MTNLVHWTALLNLLAVHGTVLLILILVHHLHVGSAIANRSRTTLRQLLGPQSFLWHFRHNDLWKLRSDFRAGAETTLGRSRFTTPLGHTIARAIRRDEAIMTERMNGAHAGLHEVSTPCEAIAIFN